MAEDTLNDLTRPVTSLDTAPEVEPGQINQFQEQQEAERAQRLSSPTYHRDLTKDAFSTTLLWGTVIPNVLDPSFQADPNFSRPQMQANLEAAQKDLPEEFLETLTGAVSQTHFDHLYRRAKSYHDSRQRIAEAGWDGTAATFLANAVDPSTWLSYGVSIRALRAFQVATGGARTSTWIAGSAAGGAWANTATTGLLDLAGNPQSAEDYAFAAGMGLVLGAGFGALSRNPAAAGEAAALVRLGGDIIRSTRAVAEKVKASPSSMFGIRRAADEVAPKPVSEDSPTTPSTAPAQPVAAPQAVPASVLPQPTEDLQGRFTVDEAPAGGKFVVADTGTPEGAPSVLATYDTHAEAAAHATRANKLAPEGSFDHRSHNAQMGKKWAEQFARKGKLKTPAPERGMAAIAQKPRTKKAPVQGNGFYDYGDVIVRRSDDGEEEGRMLLTSQNRAGKSTGFVELKQNPDGRWEIDMIEVAEQFRGQGIAKHLNTAAVAETGQPYSPSGRLTPDGFTRASKIMPWVEDYYRPQPDDLHYRPEGGVKLYLSPKQLTIQRHMLAEDITLNPRMGAEAKAKKVALLKRYDEELDSLPPEARDPRNWQALGMFSKRDPMRGVGPMKADAEAVVRQLLNRILPKWAKIDVRITDEIVQVGGKKYTPGTLDGYYINRVIHLARNADNMAANAYHEGIHALRALGLFSPDDWAKLVTKANSRPLKALRERVERLYKDEDLTPDQIDEELVAHMLAGRSNGETFGLVDRILEHTTHFLRSLRNALDYEGLRTTQDIFDDVNTGAIAQRDPSAFENQGGLAAKAEANAARNPVVVHDYLQDGTWKSIQDEQVPTAAGKYRFDRAWTYGKSMNAAMRAVGNHLLNNVVGQKNHEVNAWSADLEQMRVYDIRMTEFNQHRVATFKEWADSLNLGPNEALVRQDEFYRQVGRAERSTRFHGPPHPAVKKLRDAVAKILDEARQDLNNPFRNEGLEGRPVAGAGEHLVENKAYLPRLFDFGNLHGAIETFGHNGVARMLGNAMDAGRIKNGLPPLDPALRERVADAYLRTIDEKGVGLGQHRWQMAISQNDHAKLAALLRNDVANISDGEIDNILSWLFPKSAADGGGTASHLKRRTLFDETFVEKDLPTIDEDTLGDLHFADILENDITKIMGKYMRWYSGRLALARVRIVMPDRPQLDGSVQPGHTIVNGLTSDSEIEELISRVHEYGADASRRNPAYTNEQLRQEVDSLRFDIGRILGHPDPAQMTNQAWYLRMVRGAMVTRLLGQVGIAQAGETGTMVATLGLRAAVTQMPAVKRILAQDGKSVLAKEHFAYLESIGIGVERMHGLRYHNLDEIGETPFGTSTGRWKDTAEQTVRTAEWATFEGSGMAFVQQQQERAGAAMIVQDWANMAKRMKEGKGPDQGWRRRAAQLGISEPMFKRVFDEINTWADFKDGTMFPDRVMSLNAQKWTDLEAKVAFERSIYRYIRKLIQKGDQGSMASFMNNPLWQTIFQFRNFPLTAWANQFQYGLHMRDFRTFNSFTWSTVWNAIVRYGQVQLLAAGRSDRDKYLEKHTSWFELGKAGFQRSGWSSILPMGIDTALLLGGNREGIFNARSSGQPSNVVFGAPVLSAIDSAHKGIGGLTNAAWNMRTPSQGEMRDVFSLLPFSNMMPIMQGYNYMIGGLPERAPPIPR